MLGRMMKAGLLAAALLSAVPASATDYARERKWAAEIKPTIVVGDPIDLTTTLSPYPFLSIFAPADPARAVILVHGLGVHPDWGIIGQLRTALTEHGYTTMSIQMPLLAADADPNGYRALIPEGASRISRAASFLEAQGYSKIVIVSHSLGSRMVNLYMTKPSPYVRAWASLGLTDPAFATTKLPILDLYGEIDDKPVLTNVKARAKTLKNKNSKQQKLAGADHFYEGHEAEMIAAVEAFLDKAVGKPVAPKPEADPSPAAEAAKPAAQETAPAAPAPEAPQPAQ